MRITKTRAIPRGVNASEWYIMNYTIEPMTTIAKIEVGGWTSTASHDAGDMPLWTEFHQAIGGAPWPFSEGSLTGSPANYEETAIDWLLTLAEFSGGTKN